MKHRPGVLVRGARTLILLLTASADSAQYTDDPESRAICRQEEEVHPLPWQLLPAKRASSRFLYGSSCRYTCNQAVEWAQKGAAVTQADPAVAAVARANASIFYCLGFDVGTRLYGDPTHGADGNTATGPGALAIRDALEDPDSIRGLTTP
jgi:hypothetical protein